MFSECVGKANASSREEKVLYAHYTHLIHEVWREYSKTHTQTDTRTSRVKPDPQAEEALPARLQVTPTTEERESDLGYTHKQHGQTQERCRINNRQ